MQLTIRSKDRKLTAQDEALIRKKMDRVPRHLDGISTAEVIITHELCESSLFNRTAPGTLFGTGGSSIGFSAPMAIGVKVAAPDRQVHHRQQVQG